MKKFIAFLLIGSFACIIFAGYSYPPDKQTSFAVFTIPENVVMDEVREETETVYSVEAQAVERKEAVKYGVAKNERIRIRSKGNDNGKAFVSYYLSYLPVA